MPEIAKMHTERLEDLKKNVENAHTYFSENYERFHKFVKFVFESSLNEDDRQTLQDLGKPDIEFNILESFVSRLRGEFAKQQPSLKVRAADGIPLSMMTDKYTATLDVIEQHLRAIFFDANNDKLEYNIYSDLLAGGFSVMEVYTDHVSEMSFEQNIFVDRAFDVTLCGFDPLARESHKGDGEYCFKIFPMTRKYFEKKYGKNRTDEMKFARNIDGFGWSYKGTKDDMVLLCDYFEKQRKEETIIKFTTGDTILKKDYDKYMDKFREQYGIFQKEPTVTNERKTTIERIVRYRFCETGMIDHKETSFKHLPLVFVDGNSAWITDGETQKQMTRPYVYHAEGIQKLKNFAGQTLANELENLVQHKFIVAKESIPEGYEDVYEDLQKASTLTYNHFLDSNAPDVQLPPPREIQRPPIPREITDAFRMSDEMTQVILGSYDSQQGANKNELSGAAIAMGAMQSNNASVPYIVGYIKGLNRVAQIIVDLIPKYYRTPRSLPILKPNGQRGYVKVNTDEVGKGEQPIYMNYDPNTLQVKVETGVNFSMQKELALKTLINLMQASPKFAEFMNDEGLFALLDNIDIRGIDELKAKAEKYEMEAKKKKSSMEQMQEQIQQIQSQLQIKRGQALVKKEEAEAAKTMREAQAPTSGEVSMAKVQQDGEFKTIDAQQNQQQVDMDMTELMAKLQNIDEKQMMEYAKLDAEQSRTAVETLHEMIQAINTGVETHANMQQMTQPQEQPAKQETQQDDNEEQLDRE